MPKAPSLSRGAGARPCAAYRSAPDRARGEVRRASGALPSIKMLAAFGSPSDDEARSAWARGSQRDFLLKFEAATTPRRAFVVQGGSGLAPSHPRLRRRAEGLAKTTLTLRSTTNRTARVFADRGPRSRP